MKLLPRPLAELRNRLLNRLSVAQTVALSLLGSAISASPILWDTLWRRQHHTGLVFGTTDGILLYLGLILGGFVVAFSAESSLRDGIACERWPEQHIATLRKYLGSAWCVGLMVLGLVVYVALSFPIHHNGGAGWIAFLFTQNISRLSIAAKDPANTVRGAGIDWSNCPPLHSDHWGER